MGIIQYMKISMETAMIRKEIKKDKKMGVKQMNLNFTKKKIMMIKMKNRINMIKVNTFKNGVE